VIVPLGLNLFSSLVLPWCCKCCVSESWWNGG